MNEPNAHGSYIKQHERVYAEELAGILGEEDKKIHPTIVNETE